MVPGLMELLELLLEDGGPVVVLDQVHVNQVPLTVVLFLLLVGVSKKRGGVATAVSSVITKHTC